jgi:hypothetical protein
MGAEQSKPKGPDLARGVPLGDVADGGMHYDVPINYTGHAESSCCPLNRNFRAGLIRVAYKSC